MTLPTESPPPLHWLGAVPPRPLGRRAAPTVARRAFAAAPALRPRWNAALAALPDAAREAVVRVVAARLAYLAEQVAEGAPAVDPAVLATRWVALAEEWAAAVARFPAQLSQLDPSFALATKYCDTDARARAGSGIEWAMASVIAARHDIDTRVVAIPTQRRKRCDYAVFLAKDDGTLGECTHLYEIKAFVSPLPELTARNGLIVKRMLNSGSEQLLVTRSDAAVAQASAPTPHLVVLFAESDRAVMERIAPHLADPAATAQHAAEQLIARVLVQQQQQLSEADPRGDILLGTYDAEWSTQLY